MRWLRAVLAASRLFRSALSSARRRQASSSSDRVHSRNLLDESGLDRRHLPGPQPDQLCAQSGLRRAGLGFNLYGPRQRLHRCARPRSVRRPHRVPFLDRVHFLHITTRPGVRNRSPPVLLDTRFLRNEFGQPLLGAAGAFDLGQSARPRGVSIPRGSGSARTGTFYISDEYGPYLFEFDRQGHFLPDGSSCPHSKSSTRARIPPDELTGQHVRSASEPRHGGSGDQPLCTTLYGIMQNRCSRTARSHAGNDGSGRSEQPYS